MTINMGIEMSYIFSAFRIFLTILIFDFFLLESDRILRISFLFFRWTIVTNSFLILLGILFPSVQDIVYSITGQPPEFFRFSGFLGSFQIHSFLVLLYLWFAPPPSFLLSSALALSCLFTSRSILPLVLSSFVFQNLYIFCGTQVERYSLKITRKSILTFLIISCLICYVLGSTDLASNTSKYMQSRLFTLIDFSNTSISSSIDDNIRLLNLPFNISTLFGFGMPRFLAISGFDSFYTRWIFGVGILVFAFLEILKITLCFRVTSKFELSFLYYIIFLFVDLKGDMILTTLPLIFILLFSEKARRQKLKSLRF